MGDRIDILKGCAVCLHFMPPDGRTRTHRLKLQGNLDTRKNFLIVSAVQYRNNLPCTVVNSPSLGVFKQKLEGHLAGMLSLPVLSSSPEIQRLFQL